MLSACNGFDDFDRIAVVNLLGFIFRAAHDTLVTRDGNSATRGSEHFKQGSNGGAVA